MQLNKKHIFSVRVTSFFKATHFLRQYHGQTESPHQHHWKVEVVIISKKLDDEGMVVDFLEIKNTLDQIVKPFHQANINSIHPFKKINPTTENIALYIHKKLINKMRQKKYQLKKVELFEGPHYSAAIQ